MRGLTPYFYFEMECTAMFLYLNGFYVGWKGSSWVYPIWINDSYNVDMSLVLR